jgi:predicted transcriptional regulator
LVVILGLFAMTLKYNLKLDARTLKLEKKNGKEQKEINELKKKDRETDELKQRFKQLEKTNHLLVEKVLKESELKSRS